MQFIKNLFNDVRASLTTDPYARQSNGVILSTYRKPWWNYWTECAGDGFMVVGGPTRKALICLPYQFPDRPCARAVAKFMTKSARIRVTGQRVG